MPEPIDDHVSVAFILLEAHFHKLQGDLQTAAAILSTGLEFYPAEVTLQAALAVVVKQQKKLAQVES